MVVLVHIAKPGLAKNERGGQQVETLKKVKISKSPEETFKIAQGIAKNITKSILVGLKGELGSGKTVFAKGFASGLGVNELITSPTFLGISESNSGRLYFVHMDFYKKVVTKEIINNYLSKKAVILIEWIDNYSLVFNEEIDAGLRVYIQYVKDKNGEIIDNERQITISNSDVILINL